jgi:RimJ/RimL family protein N-acetyltransferase
LHRITLGVIENNIAAVKLYYKIGFVQEQRYEYHGKHSDKFTHALRMAIFNKNF